MTGANRIRCAIYTRKSSEDGLDQAFNSLDAQHEACAAYITSQRQEGWRAVRERYDDGGLSGGSLERPALQRLMRDIDAGRITMVVVYKIDRLTRSLADFARLVERFEAAGCSFVSVTQAFNTATSMGRLTLNVLLSFAQFEREVTAERIRDKIAASKKKGMWMGGMVPLGYDRHPDPKRPGLIVNDAEAERVRTLFRLYDRHGCLRIVHDEAKRLGIRSKARQFASGKRYDGGALSRGQIHFLLTNPLYIGRIRHKAQTWPGQHQAIVDDALWSKVQEKLQAASRRPRRRGGRNGAAGHREMSAPLTGKLRDETGDRLTPTHTTRRGRRHRYYVSHRLLSRQSAEDTSGWRLPAKALEQVVAKILADHIAAQADRQALIGSPNVDQARSVSTSAGRLVGQLRDGDTDVLRSLIATARIAPGTIGVELDRDALAAALGVATDQLETSVLTVETPLRLRRRGVETRIIAGTPVPQPDPVLVRRLAEAHRWLARSWRLPARRGIRQASCAASSRLLSWHRGSRLRSSTAPSRPNSPWPGSCAPGFRSTGPNSGASSASRREFPFPCYRQSIRKRPLNAREPDVEIRSDPSSTAAGHRSRSLDDHPTAG